MKLGHALQLTNIIRDVGHDWDFDDRIYLPTEEMESFGYSVDKLKQKVYDDSFLSMMRHHAKRARGLFAEAADLLPAKDKKYLLAARMMGEMYKSLLNKIERNDFDVFDRVHKLTKVKKVSVLCRFFFQAFAER